MITESDKPVGVFELPGRVSQRVLANYDTASRLLSLFRPGHACFYYELPPKRSAKKSCRLTFKLNCSTGWLN